MNCKTSCTKVNKDESPYIVQIKITYFDLV